MKYLDLYNSGELQRRVIEGYRRLAACDLCPRKCGVNRVNGSKGWCRSGLLPKVASANLHKGEEPPISGSQGSGTIFFSGCTMGCLFCQNYPISHLNNGKEITILKLAEKMLDLQKRGAHNINFVTPTHFLPQILAALEDAIPLGFKLPLLWNSNGYESVESLKLLEGVVSVYLPDMKYSDDFQAKELSFVTDYVSENRLAVKEMHRQTGFLHFDDAGIAANGLIIRHLVLPSSKAGSDNTLKWISENIGKEASVSLMSQYFPAGDAVKYESINRGITAAEYEEALALLEKHGLENGWVQEIEQERSSV